MNALFGFIIVGALAGLVGGLAVLVFALAQKTKSCPECGVKMPKFRKPANRQQMLWGGWTCSECGCEINRKGQKVNSDDIQGP